MEKIVALLLVLFLLVPQFCSDSKSKKTAESKQNLELATKYYNSDNYSKALPLYKNVIFADDSTSGTTFYRFAYSWEKAEPKKVSSYAPFYSAAAYRFEKDKDTKNKYYDYAIAKEKNFDINHDNFDEEKLKSLVRAEKKRDSKFYISDKVLFIITIAVFLVFMELCITAILSRRKKTLKQSGYTYHLSDLFATDYFYQPSIEELNRLDSIYFRLKNYSGDGWEDFLLYKFGQIIFTKEKNKNDIDYKIVDKGLTQFFPKVSKKPDDVQTSNKRINFINKIEEFFKTWHIIQEKYDFRLYEIPEWGTLATVMKLRISDDGHLSSAFETINRICDDCETLKIKSYKRKFLILANKLYHETNESNSSLLAILDANLGKYVNKIKLKISCRKSIFAVKNSFNKLMITLFPVLVFVYCYLALTHILIGSSLIVIFLLSVLSGIFGFFLKKILNTTAKEYIPITETERIVRARKLAEQEEQRRMAQATSRTEKSRNSQNSNFGTTSKKFADEDSFKDKNDGYHTPNYSGSYNYEEERKRQQGGDTEKRREEQDEYEREQREQQNVENMRRQEERDKLERERREAEKRKLQEEREKVERERKEREEERKREQEERWKERNKKYYCEYCGYDRHTIRELTNIRCPKHPLGVNKGYHKPYEGEEKDKYYCEYCGYDRPTIRELTHICCPKHPLGANKGYHKPYEGNEKTKYECEYCGYTRSTIRELTNVWCPRHPLGANKGYHKPRR